MGMYTEVHFNVKLKQDVPNQVISILHDMVEGKRASRTADHEFFDCDRWKWLFTSDSYYFAADTHSTIRYDSIGLCWYLNVRSNIKNYFDEIQKFCAWIDPYISADTGDFLGFMRYESNEDPDLIRKS